jgi:hypothetical protein
MATYVILLCITEDVIYVMYKNAKVFAVEKRSLIQVDPSYQGKTYD